MDAPPTLRLASSILAEGFDALLFVVPSPLEAHLAELDLPASARAAVESLLAIDQGLAKGQKSCVVLAAPGVPGRSPRARDRRRAHRRHRRRPRRRRGPRAAVNARRGRRRDASRCSSSRSPPGRRFARALEVAALAALGTPVAPARSARGRQGRAARRESLGIARPHEPARARVAAIESGPRPLPRHHRHRAGAHGAACASPRSAKRRSPAPACTVTVERDVAELSAARRRRAGLDARSSVTGRAWCARVRAEGAVTRTIIIVRQGRHVRHRRRRPEDRRSTWRACRATRAARARRRASCARSAALGPGRRASSRCSAWCATASARRPS